MRVKFLSLDAGPDGVRQANSVHDVPEAEARDLIAGGYAEPFKGGDIGPAGGAPKAKADGAQTETATAGPQAKATKSRKGK